MPILHGDVDIIMLQVCLSSGMFSGSMNGGLWAYLVG